MAVLSGKVPNYIPPDPRDEEGWCRLATDGLRGKLKDRLHDETGTVLSRGVLSGTILVGYGPLISTSGTFFCAMAVGTTTKLLDQLAPRAG